MMDFDPAQPWYHGSPFALETLRAGSTITQKRDLARIFSHKPTLVEIADDGRIRHNGATPGYLYTVSDAIQRGAPGRPTRRPRARLLQQR